MNAEHLARRLADAAARTASRRAGPPSRTATARAGCRAPEGLVPSD